MSAITISPNSRRGPSLQSLLSDVAGAQEQEEMRIIQSPRPATHQDEDYPGEPSPAATPPHPMPASLRVSLAANDDVEMASRERQQTKRGIKVDARAYAASLSEVQPPQQQQGPRRKAPPPPPSWLERILDQSSPTWGLYIAGGVAVAVGVYFAVKWLGGPSSSAAIAPDPSPPFTIRMPTPAEVASNANIRLPASVIGK